jgi:hypothetical protein
VSPAQGRIPTYEVYLGTTPNFAQAEKQLDVPAPDSNLVQANIEGLTNEILYYLWVRAVFGDLGKADPTMTTGIPVPPPLVPANLNVYPGEGMLELHWDAVKNAVTYEVYTNAGGAGNSPPNNAELSTVSTLGTVVAGLTNGESVTVWVRASNTAGKSGYVTKSVTPRAETTPPAKAPANIKVTAGEGKLTLTWDQVQGVPFYKLFFNTAGNNNGAEAFSVPIPADSPKVTAELTGLTNNTQYYVWVKSSNSQGDSPFSDPVFETPIPKPSIKWNDLAFVLGRGTAEYPFAQDLPPSVFFPEGRPYTDRLTRVQETALGNLFADGAAWYVRKTYPEENIDFVFLNGGYIDNVLPMGEISVGGLSSVVGPSNRRDNLLFLSLTGKQLKAFFEEVAMVIHMGRGGANTGWFGVVSKEVRYTIQYPKAPEGISPELEDEEREPYLHGRIKPGTLKVKPHDSLIYDDIEDSKVYRICTTDYLAKGEYYFSLADFGQDKLSTKVPFWHAVGEYVYDKGTVTPATDGRIKLEGGVPLPEPWTEGDWEPEPGTWPPVP